MLALYFFSEIHKNFSEIRYRFNTERFFLASKILRMMAVPVMVVVISFALNGK